MTNSIIPEKRHFSINILKSLVRLDPETGKLFWKNRTDEFFRTKKPEHILSWNNKYAEREAFCTICKKGYKKGCVLKQKYLAHHIVWALSKGIWPKKDMVIDHINGDRKDNRIKNLREVTTRINSRNNRLDKRNKIKEANISWSEWHKSFRVCVHNADEARIRKDFKSLDEAVLFRDKTRKELGYTELWRNYVDTPPSPE